MQSVNLVKNSLREICTASIASAIPLMTVNYLNKVLTLIPIKELIISAPSSSIFIQGLAPILVMRTIHGTNLKVLPFTLIALGTTAAMGPL